jgi:hypothetical protein
MEHHKVFQKIAPHSASHGCPVVTSLAAQFPRHRPGKLILSLIACPPGRKAFFNRPGEIRKRFDSAWDIR